MEDWNAFQRKYDITMITADWITFASNDRLGFIHTSGKTKGPTNKNPITIDEVL